MTEFPFCRRTALAVFLGAACLWVLNHPLLSIDNHDARIYSILALHWLTPEAYARDPFFMFGSQDSYSLFSPLYGYLIQRLGMTVAAAVVFLVGGLIWCCAAMALAWGLGLSRWVAAMSIFATVTLCLNYSPNGATFLLNEGFATARSIALPLSGLALAICLHRRTWVASLLAFAATLLHPLIGIWALAVTLLWPLSWRRRWLLCMLACTFLMGLMLAEIGPFARFDAEWGHLLRTHTWDVFVAEHFRWREYGLQLLLLLVVGFHTRQTQAGHLYWLVALVGLTSLSFSIFASWLWPSMLVIQAQLWRGMWLAVYLMPFALCHLLMLLVPILRPVKGNTPWALMAVLAVVFMFKDQLLYMLLLWCAGILLVHWGVCTTCLLDARARIKALIASRWLPLLTMGLLFLAIPSVLVELDLLDGTVPVALSMPPQLAGLLLHGGAGLGFALLAWGIVRYGSRWGVSAGLALLLIMLFMHWDMRNARDRAWEQHAAFGRNDRMSALIKPGDVVLWDGRMPLQAWYELRTAHYASPIQAIGIVFSREKTYELLARVARVRAAYIHEQGEAVVSYDGLHAFAFWSPTGVGIPMLCQDSALDWVVTQPVGPPAISGAIAIPDDTGEAGAFFYLFRCSDYRAEKHVG